jgi:hypothetical protein
MRRVTGGRAFGLIMAAWFSVATLSRAYAHDCVSDSHQQSAVSAIASVQDAHTSHTDHATPSSGTGSGGASHECDCLGVCCPSTVPSLVVVPESLAAMFAIVAAVPSQGNTAVHATVDEHLLPFSIGPPAQLTA